MSLFLGSIGLYAHAVTAKKDGANWVVETDMYTINWKTNAQAGYEGGIAKGGAKNVLGIGQGRVLYHSANYAGWKDWGPTEEVKEVEKGPGKLVLYYRMNDGLNKIYHCTATYWDGVPYFKHEIVVEAKGDVVSFSDGHEPMLEPRNAQKNTYEQWNDPFPHGAVSNENGYFGMYASTQGGIVELFPGWAPDGRFHLVHNALGKPLKKGAKSEPLVYHLALGKGAGKEAHALAPEVTKEPRARAVSASGKLATSWGELKSR